MVGHFLHLGAWPLIMGVTMWAQMKLNPAPPDPTQKMIFDWMPLIFTFMLATFPAGLVIYWAWNNSLSVLQQSVIMRKHGAKIELFDNIKALFVKKKPQAMMFVLKFCRNVVLRSPGTAPMDEFTRDEIEAGRRLFAGDWRFVAAAGSAVSLPPMRGTEIALCRPLQCRQVEPDQRAHRPQGLARTSRTPGRTQELIFFTARRPAQRGGYAGLRLCRRRQEPRSRPGPS